MNTTPSRTRTPAPKIDTLTKAEKKALEAKIDEEVEESFPASDPPAFNAGGTVGAPDLGNKQTSKDKDEKGD